MEFHIARTLRDQLQIDDILFSYTGNVIFANVAASRKLAQQLNLARAQADPTAAADPSRTVNAGALFAMGLIDELNHVLVRKYRTEVDPSVLTDAMAFFARQNSPEQLDRLLLAFTQQFPNTEIYRGRISAQQWLKGTTEDGLPNREAAFEELMLLWLANANPAFKPFRELFPDGPLKQQTIYKQVTEALPAFFTTRPPLPEAGSLIEALTAPFLASPDSLTGQLDFIRGRWTRHLGPGIRRVLLAIDTLREEDLAIWLRFHPPTPDQFRHGAPGRGNDDFAGDEYIGFEDQWTTDAHGNRVRRYATDYQAPLVEYEAFSADQAWMPNVVLMAKSTYVWLEQLSQKYQRHIHRLDHIPDEELQLLARRGITGLWLIGLWERSTASRTIKRLRGHADAVASAYSLKEYSIAEDLGGNEAYETLRNRAAAAGLRLASDMVPNHMGIDSNWVIENPDWFLYRWESPFPSYSFEGPDLSTDSRVEIKLEDHYYDQTDAAVVFRLRHHANGATRFMYHGNDGTTFAWNDTAQLDYSKAAVREHVIQTILYVARLFPIIRFDAAMVLAKRHVQRLWFPLPGAGGSIPSRAEDAISQEEFDALMPHEFWREVVDRVAQEVPGTLLLAEAFWMLESYFVRTLGMHRVYNSAFMHMLRDEDNAKYRSYLKKTIEFDPDILKRYVNFMSNPDERTAIDQFGSGDKFFGVATLMATLPGLPMFGHGQIEGFTERYGMEFKQAKMQETPNRDLVARHMREIAPLLHRRHLFAESTHFVLYDFWTGYGTVNENVFAYSNQRHGQRALILYNNSYGSTQGTIHISVASMDKSSGELRQRSLSDGLSLPLDNSLLLAWRDTASNLEYLRRSTDFHSHGLTVDLRGYQYAVLLDWRELHATAEAPWDRLCDALAGQGVSSLDDALARLRLRPLHESLRHAISPVHIQSLAALAYDTAHPAELPPVAPGHRTTLTPATSPEPATTTLDPRVLSFVEHAELFYDRWLSSLTPEDRHQIHSHNESDPPSAPSTLGPDPAATEPLAPAQLFLANVERLTLATLQLTAFERHFSTAWPPNIRQVLPIVADGRPAEPTWAPALAWILLSSLPWPTSPSALFDKLQLRSALGEIFSSLGLEGESAWQAAARVRLQLLEPAASTTLYDPNLWNLPDVRWLTGVNLSDGNTWFNKESFEALLTWRQLPALLEAAAAPNPEPPPAPSKNPPSRPRSAPAADAAKAPAAPPSPATTDPPTPIPNPTLTSIETRVDAATQAARRSAYNLDIFLQAPLTPKPVPTPTQPTTPRKPRP
jgi:glycosidase